MKTKISLTKRKLVDGRSPEGIVLKTTVKKPTTRVDTNESLRNKIISITVTENRKVFQQQIESCDERDGKKQQQNKSTLGPKVSLTFPIVSKSPLLIHSTNRMVLKYPLFSSILNHYFRSVKKFRVVCRPHSRIIMVKRTDIQVTSLHYREVPPIRTYSTHRRLLGS